MSETRIALGNPTNQNIILQMNIVRPHELFQIARLQHCQAAIEIQELLILNLGTLVAMHNNSFIRLVDIRLSILKLLAKGALWTWIWTFPLILAGLVTETRRLTTLHLQH